MSLLENNRQRLYLEVNLFRYPWTFDAFSLVDQESPNFHHPLLINLPWVLFSSHMQLYLSFCHDGVRMLVSDSSYSFLQLQETHSEANVDSQYVEILHYVVVSIEFFRESYVCVAVNSDRREKCSQFDN